VRRRRKRRRKASEDVGLDRKTKEQKHEG